MMRFFLYFFLLFFFGSTNLGGQKNYTGFFDFTWEAEKGKIMLKVKNPGSEFLYVNSLAAGVGSNDIGLDRGQLGSERIVKFEKVGEKILLIEPNMRYRAISNNKAEVNSMEEAFAQSVIGGFKIEKEEAGVYTIDLTDFLLQDAHHVAETLKNTGQGTYKVDKGRSAIYLPNTLSFPDNTEFESMITFAGEPNGREIRTVAPDARSVTVRMHHSFVRLPDDQFKPRAYHPYSGFFDVNFYDYATPIYSPTNKKYIVRHRLEKKDPSAKISEAVEPIIYYIDPGCPEPVKSALMEGASWWNQAFEAAGYKDAFQVKELPEGAHPLDVRYNMIQWVHRSTRGWSYGSAVVDPRTGEIIKGHVSLGSLRVRQDFMIAQGILSPYGKNQNNHDPMMEVALARLRQLSAHEVGHTIGLAHNFAASYNDRASVMDYPHPNIDIKNGKVKYDDAYDDKIGTWDKRTVLYGYQDFPDNKNEQEELQKIIIKTQKDGYLYISDPDARPTGGAHPYGHLWDNGKSPIDELNRMVQVRSYALENFGEATIPEGTPYSELEKILVPVYLMHRYQVEAVSKLLGGLSYNYSVKGDALDYKIKTIEKEIQEEALEAMLATLHPDFLKIPDDVLEVIPPAAYGYSRDRESFSGNTGLVFDPLRAAESSANTVMELLLHPQRLSRINQQDKEGLFNYLDDIGKYVYKLKTEEGIHEQYVFMVQKMLTAHLINLSLTAKELQIRAMAEYILNREYQQLLESYAGLNDDKWAHLQYLKRMREEARLYPDKWKLPEIQDMPPGSPIGCGMMH
jgi:hypothetical protein